MDIECRHKQLPLRFSSSSSRADGKGWVFALAETLLRQFDKGDARRVMEILDSVVEQSKNDEYREIRGMNRRFTQLDHSLRNAEGLCLQSSERTFRQGQDSDGECKRDHTDSAEGGQRRFNGLSCSISIRM